MYKTNTLENVIIGLLYFSALIFFLIYITNSIYLIVFYVFASIIFIFYLLRIFKRIEIHEKHVIIEGMFNTQIVDKHDINISLFNPKGILTIRTHIHFEIRIKSRKKVIGFLKFDKIPKAQKFEQFLKENNYSYSFNNLKNSNYY